ncbi:unnamed protein product [Rhizopus stolonifer]
MLSTFYSLISITIKGEMPPLMAKRIFATFPMAPSIIDLKIYCDSTSRTIMQKHAQSITKRNIIVEVNGSMNKKRKRTIPVVDTPSPIKEALRPMKQMYEASKLEFCKLMSLDVQPNISVPAALLSNNLTKSSEYKKLQIKDLDGFYLQENLELQELNTMASKLSNKLAECIIQFDDHWIMVTEYEMYVRNCRYIDDCAQDSFWLMYPDELEVYEIKKNEKGHSWTEICMFWDRLEFLVTGGFRGNYSDDTVIPFLGSALQPLRPVNSGTKTSTKNVIIKTIPCATIQTTRRLQQYNKSAAKQGWLFKSSKFVKKGFHTTNPLEVYKFGRIVNMASVASFLLSKIVDGEFSKNDIQFTLNLLAETKLFPDMQNDMKLFVFKRKLKLLVNLPTSHQVIIKCFFKLAEGNRLHLSNDDILSVYRGTLANHCKNEDIKKIKQKLYLL